MGGPESRGAMPRKAAGLHAQARQVEFVVKGSLQGLVGRLRVHTGGHRGQRCQDPGGMSHVVLHDAVKRDRRRVGGGTRARRGAP